MIRLAFMIVINDIIFGLRRCSANSESTNLLFFSPADPFFMVRPF
jgi:hypothetical protein